MSTIYLEDNNVMIKQYGEKNNMDTYNALL